MITQADIDEIRSTAVVEHDGSEYIATKGDFSGHGDTRESAIENLVIGIEYFENE